MAQQVVIAGALFNDVPAISVPDSNNVYHDFLDTTIAINAASASDIASGKLAYVNGSLVTGTGSGGGGLVYETGTLTPTADIADVTISFANAHTTAPIFAMLCDTSTNDIAESSNFFSAVVNNYGYMGFPYTKGSTYRYGTNVYAYAVSTSLAGNITNLTSTTSINTYISSSGFRAYSGSSSRYWRAGRTYKWIAVWAPTS